MSRPPDPPSTAPVPAAPSPAAAAPVPPVAEPSRGLEFKAMLLLLGMAVLLAASFFYLLYARGAFEQTQTLVLIAEDSEGVRVGMDMTFSGFPIGRVRRIALGEDGNARIVVDVPVKDARWLRETSVFVLTRGIVGGVTLRAYSGLLDDPPLPPGAERRVLAGDATTEIPRLVASARELVANLTALTQPDAELARTLGEMRRFAERLNGPGGVIAAAVGDEGQARRVATRLEAAVGRADGLLARIDGVVARADARVLGPDGVLRDTQAGVADLRALLADARGSVERLNGVLDETRAIAGDVRGATTDLDALRAEVETSLRRIDHLIGEVNRKWPFARDPALKLP